MHCRGFGIQSPTDYWMVRYVINEHWPYYPYATIGQGDDWLRKKKGRLYFRLANWRQPRVITSRDYREYLQAGCRKAAFGNGDELMFLTVENGWRTQAASFLNKVDSNSVLVVEDIWKDWDS